MTKDDLLKLKQNDYIVITSVKGNAPLHGRVLEESKAIICKLRRPVYEGTTTLQLQVDTVDYGVNYYRYEQDLTIVIDTCTERYIDIAYATAEQIAYFMSIQKLCSSLKDKPQNFNYMEQNKAINVLTLSEQKLSVALRMIGISLPDKYVIRFSELLRYLGIKIDEKQLNKFSLNESVDLENYADSTYNERLAKEASL